MVEDVIEFVVDASALLGSSKLSSGTCGTATDGDALGVVCVESVSDEASSSLSFLSASSVVDRVDDHDNNPHMLASWQVGGVENMVLQ